MSIFYTVDSNSLFEVKFSKPKGNLGLNTKTDNTLNNQVQVTKKISVDSVIANAKCGLRKMKIQFPEKLKIALLNINSIRNKFHSLSFITENNVDILLISETKLDGLFPSGQFNICGFSMPYRCDRDSMGGGLILYIRDDISTKLLKHDFGPNIENMSVEMNLRKRKWFFNGFCNPHKN